MPNHSRSAVGQWKMTFPPVSKGKSLRDFRRRVLVLPFQPYKWFSTTDKQTVPRWSDIVGGDSVEIRSDRQSVLIRQSPWARSPRAHSGLSGSRALAARFVPARERSLAARSTREGVFIWIRRKNAKPRSRTAGGGDEGRFPP